MLVALITVGLIQACSDETNQVTNEIALSKGIVEPVPSGGNAPSSQGISPYVIEVDGDPWGDRDCETVATAFNVLDGFEFSSGTLTYNNGTFDGDWPEGLSVSVTEGKYIEWSFTLPNGYCRLVNMAVIVKGCEEANVYFYPNGDIFTDSQLASTIGPGSVPCDLNNLTFCWNMEPCDETKCYNCETAMGGRNAGAGKAWWFYYDVTTEGQQTIWAGKNMNAGTVEYSGGKILISLADGWILQDTKRDKGCVEVLDTDGKTIPYSEAVKIQGYNTLPASRPAAGLFTTYKGMSLEPSVAAFPYYVIHLDVLQEVVCDEEQYFYYQLKISRRAA